MILKTMSRLLNSNPDGEPVPNNQPFDLAELTRLVRRFSVEQQKIPQQLEDLVALNYLAAVPTPPPGRKFVVDRKRVEVRLE